MAVRGVGELSRFLLVRGLWLILIDLTLIKFGWRFEVDLYRLSAGIIFVIGASMVALAVLVWLPRWAIASVALIMLGGHNLFDGVRAEELGGAWIWRVLHEPGLVPIGDGVNLYVLYPLIPWIGVMASGYYAPGIRITIKVGGAEDDEAESDSRAEGARRQIPHESCSNGFSERAGIRNRN